MSKNTHFLAKIAWLTPLMLKYHLKLMPKHVQKKMINTVLNRLFLCSLKDDDLFFLEGKVLKIVVPDIEYVLRLTNNNQCLSVVDEHILIGTDTSCKDGRADVTLTANFNDLMLMISRRYDPDTLFFQRKLSIEGNTALGLGVKNWLDSIELDILPKPLQSILNQYVNILNLAAV